MNQHQHYHQCIVPSVVKKYQDRGWLILMGPLFVMNVHTNHALLNTEEVILGGYVLSVGVATHLTHLLVHANQFQFHK